MTPAAAKHQLEAADQFLAGVESRPSAVSAAELSTLFERLSDAARVMASYQTQMKQSIPSDSELKRTLESIQARCRRLRPILESGAQYCSSRLNILSIPIQGYGPPGTTLDLQFHGEIAEEA